jgi:hypothetical protein
MIDNRIIRRGRFENLSAFDVQLQFAAHAAKRARRRHNFVG